MSIFVKGFPSFAMLRIILTARWIHEWIPANSDVPKHVLGGSECIRHSHCVWGTVEVCVKDLKHVCIHFYWSVSSGIFETCVLIKKNIIIYIIYSIRCVCKYVGFTSLPYVFFHGSVANKDVTHFSQLFQPGAVPHVLGLEFAAAEVRRARHAWRAALLP